MVAFTFQTATLSAHLTHEAGTVSIGLALFSGINLQGKIVHQTPLPNALEERARLRGLKVLSSISFWITR
jgi:hypothetical protein